MRTIVLAAAAAAVALTAGAADAKTTRHHHTLRHHHYRHAMSLKEPSQPIPYAQLDSYLKASPHMQARKDWWSGTSFAQTGTSANASATTGSTMPPAANNIAGDQTNAGVSSDAAAPPKAPQ